MAPEPPRTHRQAVGNLLLVAVTVLACTGLLIAAALTPAPAAVQPFLIVTCLGFTAAIAGTAPASLAVLRSSRDALGTLRRQLAALPEAEHPLGL